MKGKKREEFRRPTTEEEMAIVRIVEEKKDEKDEKEDLIELRIVEEMVSRQFHKNLKVFEKKESEKIPTRKTWDHAINLRDDFVPKKKKKYSLSRVERESSGVCKRSVKKGVY